MTVNSSTLVEDKRQKCVSNEITNGLDRQWLRSNPTGHYESLSLECSRLGKLSNVQAAANICTYSQSLVFLSNTYLHGRWTLVLRERLGFTNGSVVHNVSKSGGLALLWVEDWDVAINSYSHYNMYMIITTKDGFVWHFTGFYGHSNKSERHHLWELLGHLNTHHHIPWLCGGHFNEILSWNNKEDEADSNLRDMLGFRMALDACNLTNLGFASLRTTIERRPVRIFLNDWIILSLLRLDKLISQLSDNTP